MKKVITLMLTIGLFSLSTQSFAQDTTNIKKTRVRKVKTVVGTTATAAVPVATAPAVVKTVTTTKAKVATTTSSTVKATDKVFGTDAKGRTIYEGKEGGHYYMNANGKKEYVKKAQ